MENAKIIKQFLSEAEKSVLGKEQELKLALACFLAGGHLLIEDVPGVGKTTFAKTIARLLDLNFSRIQFTNDLLPSDLLGLQIYDTKNAEFKFMPGPIFHQFILADELNRGTPKTQSALLEAMEEQQVTLDGKTFELPKPFFVVATQNPRSQVGTHHLPESQLDRFMMKIKIGYPDSQHELKLLASDDHINHFSSLHPVIKTENLFPLRKQVEQITVSEKLLSYVLELLANSRQSDRFQGLSPRAGRDIVKAAKAWAMIEGQTFVLPDHVKAVLPAVITHRLSSPHGQSFDEDLLLTNELLKTTNVD